MDNRCLHRVTSENQEHPVYSGGYLENSYVDNRHPSAAPEPTQCFPSLGLQPDHAAPPWTSSPGFVARNFFAPSTREEALGVYRFDIPYAFDPSVPPPSFGCPPPRHLVNIVPSATLNAFSSLPQPRVGPPATSDGFRSVLDSDENRQQQYEAYRDRVRVVDLRMKTKTALQRKQDTQWFWRFCQSRVKLSNTTKIQQQHRLPRCDHVLRESLYGAVQLVSAIEKMHHSLKDNVENDCVWTESQFTVLKIQSEFQEIVKLFSDRDCLKKFKAKLSRVAQRRARSLRASNLMQQEERDRWEDISDKEAAIDIWRMKQINQVQEKMKEQELKLNADLVLSEVRKKQADVKRMQDILRSLEKLRRLRKEAASRKGIISEQECDKAFSSRLEWLRSVMKRRTVVYSAEEKALMVMLEGEQEEERRRKQEGRVKEESETQLKNKQRVHAILFGDDDVDAVMQPFRKYYTQAQRSLHALIQVRVSGRTFPDQKPWVNGNVRAKLRARSSAYTSGDLEALKNTRCDQRSTIRDGKRDYRD
ncbi:programmed cell death protein 7 isoform X1 [Platichthys flesus]|uniref:programmed cell death protein 7 isoform X1 n=1 Tax=Platichthys flesus TaxID=8260 RepID=UPI001A864BBB|nr:programmed cell death protein 7 isoform X1 [Platichthys flesus]